MDTINNSPSSDPKTAAIMAEIRQEAAFANARVLIERINEHCFDKCIPTPGSSLSKREETCFTQCMTKYMETWNAVAKQYARRAGQEAAVQGGSSAGGML